MSELWRQSLALHADAMAGALYTHAGGIRAVKADLSRDRVTTFDTTDAFRVRAEGIPVISSYGLRLVSEWETTTLRILAEAMCDHPGVAGPPDIYSIRHGQDSPRRHRIEGAYGVDGVTLALHGAALLEWQIIAQDGIVRNETRWGGLRLETPYSASLPTIPPAYAATTICTTQLLLGGVAAVAHNCNITLSRSLEPGQFDEAGFGNEWAGVATPDITGMASLRMSAADYQLAITQAKTTSLQLLVGPHSITLPSVRIAVKSRELVAEGLYEHKVEFLAVNHLDGLATIAVAS